MKDCGIHGGVLMICFGSDATSLPPRIAKYINMINAKNINKLDPVFMLNLYYNIY
jgi:hypothetical protein